MSKYKGIEDLDCKHCDWSLHISAQAWEVAEDESLVEAYIQRKLTLHKNNCGGNKKMYPNISNNLSDYSSIYTTYTQSEDSSLIVFDE